jgi:hypothetical protein
VAITPDSKDWTFVLRSTCSECNFDVRSFPREHLGKMIRENSDRWRTILTDPRVRQRPSEDVWSALEYACHVRDVFRLYDERLRLMIETDDPRYPNWDQDVAAVEDNYGEKDPSQIATDLAAAAADLADRFDRVDGSQWERTGKRSDGADFTIESFGRYLIHDPVHHVWDAETGLASLS